MNCYFLSSLMNKHKIRINDMMQVTALNHNHAHTAFQRAIQKEELKFKCNG